MAPALARSAPGKGAVGQPLPRRPAPSRPARPPTGPQKGRAPPVGRLWCRERMDFEGRRLRQVGGFGRRSRFLAAASGLPNAGLALGLAAGLLLAAVPPHRCRPDPALLPAALRNASGPELRNASAPPGSRCLLYRYPRPGGGPGPPNGTGPCTRGWQYALPAAGLRSTLVTQVGLPRGGPAALRLPSPGRPDGANPRQLQAGGPSAGPARLRR